MTNDHREAAIVALIDRDIERAATDYTRAAYGTLAGFECEGENRDPLGTDPAWAGYGLAYLALAGTCYRAAGRPERAVARCHEGIAIARDLFESALSDPLDRACCFEFIGDFGVIGGFSVEEGYDRAITAYETAGEANGTDDFLSWATAPMAEAARTAPQQAARNTPQAFAWDDLHGSDPDSISYLTRRPRFKRSRLPSVIERIEESGFVHPPRATTEHNNANWRCPDCGESEVHWVAGEVICLECSVRLVEK